MTRRFLGGALLCLIAVYGCSSDDPTALDRNPRNTPPTESEKISTPSAPIVPTRVLPDTLSLLTSGGAISNLGHDVEYRFDDGNGGKSPWSSDAFARMKWPNPGEYAARAQARCAIDLDVVSEWSTSNTVRTEAEQISPPNPLVGSMRLCEGSPGVFLAAGAVSDVGHPVEYQFDWGDGLSPWSAGAASHAWAGLGERDYRARARCALDPTVVSDWTSSGHVVVEAHVSPWVVELDMSSLAAVYGEKGFYDAHQTTVTYNGPRGRIKAWKLEMTGRGAGTTCKFDGDPSTYSMHLMVFVRLWSGDDYVSEAWPPMFLGLPSSNFVDSGIWIYEGDEWTTPRFVDEGTQLRVRVSPALESMSGCWANGFDFFELSSARLFVELECPSE